MVSGHHLICECNTKLIRYLVHSIILLRQFDVRFSWYSDSRRFLVSGCYNFVFESSKSDQELIGSLLLAKFDGNFRSIIGCSAIIGSSASSFNFMMQKFLKHLCLASTSVIQGL